MQFCEALGVRKGEVVSLVGAGGKTTALYRLGSELASQGWRVLVTTTTMIRPPSCTQVGTLIVESDPDDAVSSVCKALCSGRVIALASQRLEAGSKLKGVSPELVARLAELADVVILEADGAKGLSLKAPAPYEPVVPLATTIVVPVVGIDAMGRPLGSGVAHRPQLISELTGVPQGATITAAMVARLLVHRQGALKGVPVGCCVQPLINKVEDTSALGAARRVAGTIKGHPAMTRVLLGAVARDDPITESWRRVSAVVLAAGASTRFGSLKQLLPLGTKTLLQHVLDVARASTVDEVVVVLGYGAEQVAPYLPPWCRMVINENWRAGISSSIRSGLGAMDHRSEAALFLLGDQPRLTTSGIQCVLQAYYGTTRPIVVPTYRGQRGNPALFDRRFFPTLREMKGDVGGRQVSDSFPDQVLAVEMPSADWFLDIDTLADYERYRRDTEACKLQ